QVIITGYDLKARATLSAAEAARIDGDLHLAYRPAGSASDVANDVSMTPGLSTGVFEITLANLAAGNYDLKVYCNDEDGHEVIVEWRRVDVTADASFTGFSQAIVARETGGTITRNVAGVLSVNPGLYVGALDVERLLTTLTLD